MKKYLRKCRRISFLCTLLISAKAFSTNYYFSNKSGNDSRTSTQAQNPSTPWKSLSKLNAFFSSLQPGDSVLFKKGEQFFGSITITASGSASKPIVIAAYGSGAKPVITGLVKMSGWTSLGGGIWQSSANTTMRPTLNVVLLNDSVKAMGRYPNDDAPNNGYLFYQSHSGVTSITSNQIAGAKNFVGGELVLRPNRYFTDRCIITGQTSTTITYTTQSAVTPTDNFGFFFENSPATLDKFGEWYYDAAAKKLRMVLGNSSSYTVKASAVDTLVRCVSKSYITLSGIALKGANSCGVYIDGSTGFTINNCNILYTGRDAVYVNNAAGFKINGCLINYSHNRAIHSRGSNVAPLTITNNTIQNTGVYPGMGWKKANEGGMVAMQVSTDGALIQNNSVINTGYNAIVFSGDKCELKNNYINTFCFNKDDGGGIYTRNADNVSHTGMKVTGNVVINGVGAQIGTNSTSSSAHGIYFDDGSNGIEASGNTVANCNKGIFLHNSSNIIVRNNILFNNVYGFSTQHEKSGMRAITNCTLTSNTLFSLTNAQLCAYYLSSSNDIGSFGTFDSNYYCRPLLEPNGIKTWDGTAGGIIKTSVPTTTFYSLDNWKATYGKDARSSKTAVKISDTNSVYFQYNTTKSAKSFSLSGTYVGVDGKKYTGSIKLAPYASVILLKSSSTLITSNTAMAKSGVDSFKATSGYSSKQAFAIKEFTVKAQPNPSTSYFNLLIQSSSSEPVTIHVIDMAGRILQTKAGMQANTSVQFGNDLNPGMYLIEVVQGTEKRQQKVIKE